MTSSAPRGDIAARTQTLPSPTRTTRPIAQLFGSNLRDARGACKRQRRRYGWIAITTARVERATLAGSAALHRAKAGAVVHRDAVLRLEATALRVRVARRARSVARPRQVAMYLAKQLTTRSLPEIGRKFGGRDHTTVMHAVRKVEELRGHDTTFDEDVELLRRMLEG